MLSANKSVGVLVYKMYQVSFPRDVYHWSGTLLKCGSKNINNRQKLSKIGLAVLFTDYRTSNESMLAKHSYHCLSNHQEHRAFCLRCLAELVCKPARSRPLLSIAVIDFLAINQNFYRFCPFQGILRALWKVVMSFIHEKFSFGF